MTKAGPMGPRPDDSCGSGTSLAKPQHGQDGVWHWKFNQNHDAYILLENQVQTCLMMQSDKSKHVWI